MEDVLIRHCVLRVVRHGGWTWGPNRRGLLNRVTQVLPDLIAARLAEILDRHSGTIHQPIKLRIRCSMGQLWTDAGLKQIVAQAVTPEALLPLLAGATGQGPEASVRQHSHSENRTATASQPDDVRTLGWKGDLLALLQSWFEAGEIWQRLSRFEYQALALWLERVVAERSVADAPSPPALESEVKAAVEKIMPKVRNPGMIHQARLTLAVALLVRHRRLDRDSLIRAIDGAFPVSGSRSGIDAGKSAAVEPDSAEDSPPGRVIPFPANPKDGIARSVGPSAAEQTAAAGDLLVDSVLPFLVLGELHRTGALEVISAALNAIGDDGSAFAAALGLTVLPSIDGHSADAERLRRTAAAFAGTPVLAGDAELASYGRMNGALLSPVAAYLGSELARGHAVEKPLLLCRVGSPFRWLLYDSDGGFPVSWEGDLESIVGALRGFPPSVLLVPAAAAVPEAMSLISQVGRCFVTNAAPGRSEQWCRLKGAHGYWASPGHEEDPRLVEAAALMEELEHEAQCVAAALLPETRPSEPGRDDLNRISALAAATGLGMVSWHLWRDRESTNPLLALQRFSDLDGTVRYGERHVEVRVSLGRRYLDLERHGLLREIPQVPWLGGRAVCFPGP